MKAYTDIEQSKKLASILPLESADGFYEAQHNPSTDKWEYILFTGNKWASEEVVIPCWSLAALLDQLEDVIYDEDGHEYQLQIIKEGVQYYLIYDGVDYAAYYDTPLFDDLVDACVEMIIKLHEQKLL